MTTVRNIYNIARRIGMQQNVLKSLLIIILIMMIFWVSDSPVYAQSTGSSESSRADGVQGEPVGTDGWKPATYHVPAPDGPIVALVQFAVSEERGADWDSFWNTVERFVQHAAASGADIVVFPEYINVFPAFDEYAEEILAADAIADLSGLIAAGGGLPQFLRQAVRGSAGELRRLWSEIAGRYDTWIVAGTAFVVAVDGSVRNRAWVFAPDGTLAYRQDKVFLTPFEREEAGLSPGRVAAAETFEIDGRTYGLTICRDTYFDAWEAALRDVDVWIDIRANGEPYDQSVRRRFDGALPERVANVAASAGLSTSLNGEFLDLLWQGPAFVVDGDGERVFQSPEINGDAITYVTVP